MKHTTSSSSDKFSAGNPMMHLLAGVLLLIVLMRLGGSHSQMSGQEERVDFNGSASTVSLPESEVPDGLAAKEEAQPRMSSRRAIEIATNEIVVSEEDPERVVLENPHHDVEFSKEDGVRFAPRFSSMEWNWKLSHFGSEERNWLNGEVPTPTHESNHVDFHYGKFVERYVGRYDVLEQQFVLPEFPEVLKGGEDLVVRGMVNSKGRFEEIDASMGWIWREEGSDDLVSLGTVTVFDADGAILPATMRATATSTEIVVDGEALLTANFPVTVDPEIGTNDFLIGSAISDASSSSHEMVAVATHPTDEQSCVVWLQKTSAGWLLRLQMIDEVSGATEGPLMLIASGLSYSRPAVVWNGSKYVVAWGSAMTGKGYMQLVSKNAGLGSLVVFATNRLAANNSISLAVDSSSGDVLVSWVETDRELYRRSFDVNLAPVIGVAKVADNAYSIDSDFSEMGSSYMLTWEERIEAARTAKAQVLNSLGGEVGSRYTIATDLSGDGPRVAANTKNLNWLFVWSEWPWGGNVSRVYSRRLNGTTLSPKQQLSIDPVGAVSSFSSLPEVAYSEGLETYVVVWHYDVPSEERIGVQAAKIGHDAVTISQAGFVVAEGEYFFSPISFVSRIDGDTLRVVLTQSRSQSSLYEDRPPLGVEVGMWQGVLNQPNAPSIPLGVWSDPDLKSGKPAVAYRDAIDAYFVVWEQEIRWADDWQIAGRLVPASGVAPEPRIIISGQDGTVDNQLGKNRNPAVSANDDDFCVVWQAEEHFFASGTTRNEIHARLGSGSNWDDAPFAVSVTGIAPDSNSGLKAITPDVVATTPNDLFAVVWAATGVETSTVAGNPEIYVRYLSAISEAPVGAVRQVNGGAEGEVPALNPAIAFNSRNLSRYVVWEGSSGPSRGMLNGEYEIMGQLLSNQNLPIGPTWAQISTMGTPGSPGFEVDDPDVAYDPDRNVYLVVWSGEESSVFDVEIHGREIRADGGFAGLQMQISDMGPPPVGNILDTFWAARHPSVCYDASTDAFLVVWEGADNLPGLAVAEYEVYSRAVDLSSGSLGEQKRLSDLGPDGGTLYDAEAPVIAGDGDGKFLVVFGGDDDRWGLDEDRSAIFGQRFQSERVNPISDFKVTVSGGVVTVSWVAPEAMPCTVYASSNLQNWTELGTIGASEDVTTFVDPRGVLPGGQFYKVKVE